MSHFTSLPFQKQSSFQFPRHPISPPETNHDFLGPGNSPLSVPSRTNIDPEESHHASASESATARLRRVSTLTYNRDTARDRSTHRGFKSLIVVLPPPSLCQEHGQLGHTLSSGPRHRLSQGILMPLLPTMYGQLTAIAREFSFPSTTGLCLYLHFTDNGVTLSPRVSDESWQLLWSYAFDERNFHSAKPPIVGKVEFDINIHQARWYLSWLASAHRENTDVPVSVVPSVPPSVTHIRGDSRTTFTEDQSNDILETSLVAPQPRSRHMPRRLSLLDRFESTSAHQRVVHGSGTISPPEQQILSTIEQEDEPKTAKADLEQRVNSWRACSTTQPTLLATTGQVSLEPANMPNTVPLDNVMPTTQDELRLEDFSWSVSSQGPADDDVMSVQSGSHLPSVHLANRAQGSVCMSPSVCTSFGPPDYDALSIRTSFEHLPSPDLGFRMLYEAPLTPTTATSWGAPVSFPPSPSFSYRADSVGIADRQVFSRPITPLTATSWGPPSPASPISSMSDRFPSSVHLCDRCEFSRPVTPLSVPALDTPLSHLAIPYSDTAPGQQIETEYPVQGLPWTRIWPYIRSCSPVIEQSQSRTVKLDEISQVGSMGSAATVAAARQAAQQNQVLGDPWHHVWPYHKDPKTQIEHTSSLKSYDPARLSVSLGYPHIRVYPPAYPHFDIYPAIAWTESDLTLAPGIRPTSLSPSLPTSYPGFSLYPAVYPYNLDEIYPCVAHEPVANSNVLATSPWRYVWPYSSQRREMSGKYEASISYSHTDRPPSTFPAEYDSNVSVALRLPPPYPMFNLYPAVYPNNLTEIYPPVPCPQLSVHHSTQYPSFDLYPPVYPHVIPYPAISSLWDSRLTPDCTLSSHKEVLERLGGYPVLNLYSPLTTIEPLRQPRNEYPHLEIYPSANMPCSIPSQSLNYPNIIIYPDVSNMSSSNRDPRVQVKGISVLRNLHYPVFNLYPAVYPSFEIYPAVQDHVDDQSMPGSALGSSSIVLPATYSTFNIYPSVYPHLDIYPPTRLSAVTGVPLSSGEERSVRLLAHYPAFNIYPAVYPYFDLWPSPNCPVMEVCRPSKSTPFTRHRIRRSYKLTHSELHAMVMMEMSFKSRKPRTHAELRDEVFPERQIQHSSGTLSIRQLSLAQHDMGYMNRGAAHPVTRSPSTRSRSGSIATPPSLPSSVRPSTSPGGNPPLRHPQTTPSGGASLRRTLSSASRPVSVADRIHSLRESSHQSSHLPQVTEHIPTRTPTRTKSLAVPSHHAAYSEIRHDKSAVTPNLMHPHPSRQRDSLVLQRVGAYNPSAGDDSSLSSDTINKFPLPPRSKPPQPHALRPFDAPKHPYASQD